MRRAYKTAGRVCGAGGSVRTGALLNLYLYDLNGELLFDVNNELLIGIS